MTQGTTPIHVFHLPFEVSALDKIEIAYEQNKKIQIVKTKNDMVLAENNVTVRLTQEETLKFNPINMVRIQLHVVTNEGDSLVSKPIKTPVYILLDKKVL